MFTTAGGGPVDFPGARVSGPVPAPRPADESERVELAHRVLGTTAASQGLLRRTTALAPVSSARSSPASTSSPGSTCTSWPPTATTSRASGATDAVRLGVLQRDVLEVDVTDDHRTAGGEIAASGVRHYVGVPVLDALGRVLGVLCVYDRGPLTVDDARREQLRLLAGVLADHLEGVDAAGQLDRVQAILQATAEVDRADGEAGVADVLARAVHDLTPPTSPCSSAGPPATSGGRSSTTSRRRARAVRAPCTPRTPQRRGPAIATRRPVWVPDARTSSVVDGDLAQRWGRRPS